MATVNNEAGIIKFLKSKRQYFDLSVNNADFEKRMSELAKGILNASPEIEEAKWITFTNTGKSPSGKTNIYQVRQKETPHVLLGEIRWYPAFRCYSFFPREYTIYEPQCMASIINFIEVLMALHNKKNTENEF